MLSLKARVVALAATGALAALLALPAFAQALWIDTLDVSSSGDVALIGITAEPSSSDQTVSLSYDSTGPVVSGPSSVTIPAGESAATVAVETGEGYSGDEVWVGMSGPTTQGACYLFVN